MIPNLFVIDYETTDKDPKVCHPVELAILPWDGRFISTFIKPPIPIPPETSAIHHITDADVADAKDLETVHGLFKELLESCEDVPILVAHNAAYEQAIFKNLTEVSWLCTYKAALRVFPDAPNHKNETLRYWLGLSNLGRGYPQNAHSALHDCMVTYEILLYLCGKMVETKQVSSNHEALQLMIQWTKELPQLSKMPFGKHAGTKWNLIPADYLVWVVKQAGAMDEAVVSCANKELQRRKAGTPGVRNATT